VDFEAVETLSPGPASTATPCYDDNVVPAGSESARLEPNLACRPADAGLEVRHGEDDDPEIEALNGSRRFRNVENPSIQSSGTMRLALIATLLPSDSPGGAEAYVDAAAHALAERHDIVVLAGSRGSLNGIPTRHLPHLPQLDRRRPRAAKLLWHAADQWLPTVHFALVRELKALRPDIVLTHHPQGLSAAVFTAIAQLGLPHVHTAHDLNLLCMRMSMTRDGEFCGGRCLDCRIQRTIRGGAIRLDLSRLIGVSRYICQRHIQAGIVPVERTEAIRLGAEPGTARLRTAPAGELTLGFIGSLAPHKGVRTLLAAVEGSDLPWRLLVAGGGPLDEEVAAAAWRDPRIEHLGHVSGAAKEAFFDRLDLLVIPSEWEEPATFVAAEAAVRGIPAVVSARGGLPETPEARAFRSGDADELRRAVTWFVEDPARLKDASSRLLSDRNEFEWSGHIGKVDDLLAEVASERGLGLSSH
jgi:glycosyltransferase involved in cell wall biosynthesis